MPSLKNSIIFLTIIFAVLGSYTAYNRNIPINFDSQKYPALSALDKGFYAVYDSVSFVQKNYLAFINDTGKSLTFLFEFGQKDQSEVDNLPLLANVSSSVSSNKSIFDSEFLNESLVKFIEKYSSLAFLGQELSINFYKQIYKFSLSIANAVYAIGDGILLSYQVGISNVSDSIASFSKALITGFNLGNKFALSIYKLEYDLAYKISDYSYKLGNGIYDSYRLGVLSLANTISAFPMEVISVTNFGQQKSIAFYQGIYDWSLSLACVIYNTGNSILISYQNGVMKTAQVIADLPEILGNWSSRGENLSMAFYKANYSFGALVANLIYSAGDKVVKPYEVGLADFGNSIGDFYLGVIGPHPILSDMADTGEGMFDLSYAQVYKLAFSVSNTIYQIGDYTLSFAKNGIVGISLAFTNTYFSLAQSLQASVIFSSHLTSNAITRANLINDNLNVSVSKINHNMSEASSSFTAALAMSPDENIKTYFINRVSKISKDLQETWIGFKVNLAKIAKTTYRDLSYYLTPDSYHWVYSVLRNSGNNILPVKQQDLVNSSEPDGFSGVAIVPSTGNTAGDESIKQQIKNSFSDNVNVMSDNSGTSGIIRPIFKNHQGEDYIYVLVPVKSN